MEHLDTIEDYLAVSNQQVFALGQSTPIVKTEANVFLPKALCVELYEGGYAYKHTEGLTKTTEHGYTLEECVTTHNDKVVPIDIAVYIPETDEYATEDDPSILWDHGRDEYNFRENLRFCETDNEYHHEDDVIYIDDYGYALEDDENVHVCDYCGGYYHEDYPCCEQNDCPLEQWEEDYTYIAEYDTKPNDYPYFKHESDTYDTARFLLGLELEMELNDNDQDSVAHALWHSFSGKGYLSNDGSLNDGIELILMPHSLKRLQGTDFSELRELNLRSYDTKTCGMHVHVTRYSNEHDTFLALFFAHNKENLFHFSRRKTIDNHYASFKDSAREYTSSNRYQALNLRVWRTGTNEFRLFRGTITAKAILSNAELAHAICEFGRVQILNDDVVYFDWATFKDWVLANKDTYPNLAANNRL